MWKNKIYTKPCKKQTFGQIKNVTWLTKIILSKKRADNIRSCFDAKVDFTYPQNISEFDYLIENVQRNKKLTIMMTMIM